MTTVSKIFDHFRSCWSVVTRIFKEKKTEPIGVETFPLPARRKVDTNAIRARIQGLGWSLKEIPIKKASVDKSHASILQWRIIAFRGERSMEVSGKTLDEAMNTIGKTLGVIPR